MTNMNLTSRLCGTGMKVRWVWNTLAEASSDAVLQCCISESYKQALWVFILHICTNKSALRQHLRMIVSLFLHCVSNRTISVGLASHKSFAKYELFGSLVNAENPFTLNVMPDMLFSACTVLYFTNIVEYFSECPILLGGLF